VTGDHRAATDRHPPTASLISDRRPRRDEERDQPQARQVLTRHARTIAGELLGRHVEMHVAQRHLVVTTPRERREHKDSPSGGVGATGAPRMLWNGMSEPVTVATVACGVPANGADYHEVESGGGGRVRVGPAQRRL
jgi:hypothetical protein